MNIIQSAFIFTAGATAGVHFIGLNPPPDTFTPSRLVIFIAIIAAFSIGQIKSDP